VLEEVALACCGKSLQTGVASAGNGRGVSVWKVLQKAREYWNEGSAGRGRRRAVPSGKRGGGQRKKKGLLLGCPRRAGEAAAVRGPERGARESEGRRSRGKNEGAQRSYQAEVGRSGCLTPGSKARALFEGNSLGVAGHCTKKGIGEDRVVEGALSFLQGTLKEAWSWRGG